MAGNQIDLLFGVDIVKSGENIQKQLDALSKQLKITLSDIQIDTVALDKIAKQITGSVQSSLGNLSLNAKFVGNKNEGQVANSLPEALNTIPEAVAAAKTAVGGLASVTVTKFEDATRTVETYKKNIGEIQKITTTKNGENVNTVIQETTNYEQKVIAQAKQEAKARKAVEKAWLDQAAAMKLAWKESQKQHKEEAKTLKTNINQYASAQKLEAKVSATMSRFRNLPDYPELYKDYQELLNRISTLRSANGGTFNNSMLVKLSAEAAQLEERCIKAGVVVDTFGEKLRRAFGERIRYMITSTLFNKLFFLSRDLYRNVVDIDTAMTELRKVTNATAREYEKFLDNAGERAKALGVSLKEVVNATADYARLGYSINEASDLADIALMYRNVGDDVNDIDTATKHLISTMKGFGMEAKDAGHIVDVFNEVSNNFAVSAGDIGEGLQRSAAALSAAGNSFEESVAIFTAANTIQQDADVTGTALKTMSARLRASKTELEDMGEDTDGVATSISKLREEIKSLTGVDIMLNDSTFKSTYQMLDELAQVWDNLENKDVTQANVLELLFGKRQASIGAGLLNNFDIAREALATALDSEGSAQRELDKYLESIEGHISQLTASWQTFSKDFLNTDLVKSIVDLLRGLVDLVDSLIVKFGDLGGVVATTFGLLLVDSLSKFKGIKAIKGKIDGLKATFLEFIAYEKMMKSAKGGSTALSILPDGKAGKLADSFNKIRAFLMGPGGIALGVATVLVTISTIATKLSSVEHHAEKIKSLTDAQADAYERYNSTNDRIGETEREINQLKAEGVATDDIRFQQLQDELALLREEAELYKQIAESKQEDITDENRKALGQDWGLANQYNTAGYTKSIRSGVSTSTTIGYYTEESVNNAYSRYEGYKTMAEHEMAKGAEANLDLVEAYKDSMESWYDKYEDNLKAIQDMYSYFLEYGDIAEGGKDFELFGQLTATLEALDAIPVLDNVKEAADNVSSFTNALNADEIAKAAEATQKLSSSFKTLSDAFAEQAENGSLSVDTILDVIDAGYAAALQVDQETGQVRLNKEAYIQLAHAKIAEQIASLEVAKASAIAAKAALTEAAAIAEAEAAIAGLEAQIAILSSIDLSAVAQGIYNIGSAANSASNAMSKLLSGMNSLLSMTVSMLRQEYGDVSDAEKKSINAQIDALEDAKDAAQDRWDAEKDALEDTLDAYDKIIDAQIESLRREKEADDYERNKANKAKAVSDIQNQLAAIANDDSIEAQKLRLELQQQLAEAQEELDDLQRERSYDLREQALEDEKDRFDEETQAKIDSIDAQSKAEQEAYDKRIKRMRDYLEAVQEETVTEAQLRAEAYDLITNRTDELYTRLLAWNREYGDGLDATVQNAMADIDGWQQYGSTFYEALENLTKKVHDLENQVTGSINAIDKESERAFIRLSDYANDYMAAYRGAIDIATGKNLDFVKSTEDMAERIAKSLLELKDQIPVDKFNALWTTYINGIANADYATFVYGQNMLDNLQTLANAFRDVDRLAEQKGLTNEKSKQDYADFKRQQVYGQAFASGGIVDYTGPAHVDGSISNPEVVFNAQAASKLYHYVMNTPDLVKDMISQLATTGFNYEPIGKAGNTNNLGDINIVINGNADSSTVAELRKAAADLRDDVVRSLNESLARRGIRKPQLSC